MSWAKLIFGGLDNKRYPPEKTFISESDQNCAIRIQVRMGIQKNPKNGGG